MSAASRCLASSACFAAFSAAFFSFSNCFARFFSSFFDTVSLPSVTLGRLKTTQKPTNMENAYDSATGGATVCSAGSAMVIGQVVDNDLELLTRTSNRLCRVTEPAGWH